MKPRIRERFGSFFQILKRKKKVKKKLRFDASFLNSFVDVKTGRRMATLAVERSLNGLGFRPEERELRVQLKGLMHNYVEFYLTMPKTGRHASQLLAEMAKIDSKVISLISSSKGKEAAKKFADLLVENTAWVEGPGSNAKQ